MLTDKDKEEMSIAQLVMAFEINHKCYFVENLHELIEDVCDKEAAKAKRKLDVAVKALEYITCLDVNPITTDISPIERIRRCAFTAKEALKEVRDDV